MVDGIQYVLRSCDLGYLVDIEQCRSGLGVTAEDTGVRS